jgi:hypothetical protein
MSQKKQRVKPILTPKGRFRFPALNKPDEYKGELKYKSDLVVGPDDPGVREFIERLEAIRDAEVEKVKQELIDAGKPGLAKKVTTRDVFAMETDKAGEETGNILFHTKMKAEVKDKKTGQLKQLKPSLFDAKGRPITNPPEIWGGTVGRFGVVPRGSKRPADGAIGVTLYLDAVFIIDLKTGGSRDASYYGFTPEEDGYEYSGSGGGDEDNDDF